MDAALKHRRDGGPRVTVYRPKVDHTPDSGGVNVMSGLIHKICSPAPARYVRARGYKKKERVYFPPDRGSL